MESPAPDYVLVPLGFIIMASYHAWLLHRIIYRPTKTVAGINSINRRIWIRAMMEDTAQNGVLAVQTLRNSILASALMALATTILVSLIAVLMTNARGVEQSPEMLGDVGLTFKFFCLLACLLAAFLLSVQSVRYYSHASMLITVPASCQQRRAKECAASAAVNRGSCCWSMGVRACYFAVPLCLWILGSMQMVAGCIGIVVMLYFIDACSDDLGEGEEKGNAAAEETAANAQPQSVSRHDREISSVQLLEIVVLKD